MVDDQVNDTTQAAGDTAGSTGPEDQPATRRRSASRASTTTEATAEGGDAAEAPARPARKRTAKATSASVTSATAGEQADTPAAGTSSRKRRSGTKAGSASDRADDGADTGADQPTASATAKSAAKKSTAKKSAAKKSTAKKSAAKKSNGKKAAAATSDAATSDAATSDADAAEKPAATTSSQKSGSKKSGGKKSGGEKAAAEPSQEATAGDGAAVLPVFQAPEAGPRKRGSGKSRAQASDGQAAGDDRAEAPAAAVGDGGSADAAAEGGDADESGPRRRRRRGGRRRRKSGESAESSESQDDETTPESPADEGDGDPTTRRRRRRRRAGEDAGDSADDPAKTVTRVRQSRSAEDQITAVSGSTRLEAKKQRRREGREAGRRRAPIVSEAEFLARRESVERVMVIRQREDLTQIAVLEDKVLVEHYVARESQTSLIGNVYLGRVQNVLPSMEAAFIDIGKGRNAVLYAGEVNWSALGHPDGQPRKIESVLSSGQTVLVQVTKDPVGHKGARLTSQISLAGRFLVYVPDGTTSGISRKLPDTERTRLKTLLKEIVPDTAGVIVRTAAEGASEEELTRDVERLKARWEDIEKKAATKGAGATLLYGEPDLTLKVVRDLFTEDFARLVIEGDDAWDTVQGYVAHVAPDLEARLERYERRDSGPDVFSTYRIDEQIAKGLDRKVWLPSGGSLIIDRTEAMTVVDVNTGKFTGSGGNLEETVTKNNLEAAEEMVRQLRLRDIGGIIVIDFIDMVLESNRDLVLRRLVECLGRDRTRHQVAEVTSLGLVQMTRKRIGTGLLEAFSQTCEHCHGRGLTVHELPVEPKRNDDEPRRGRRGRNRNRAAETPAKPVPSPKDVAAHARPAEADESAADTEPDAGPADALESEAPAADGVEAPTGEGDAPSADLVDESPLEPAPQDAAPEEETASEEEAASEEPAPVEPAPVEPAPEEPASEEPAPEEPAAPVVVTRSRRRSASRPAGPPPLSPSGDVGAPAADGVVEPGTVEVEAAGGGGAEPAEEPSTVEHVPIKRKGARKR